MDVLTILPNGVVEGLFTEVIALSELGPLSITRASTIEFNLAAQQWEVRDDSEHRLFGHSSRQACLAWEHHHFNELMLQSSSVAHHIPKNPNP